MIHDASRRLHAFAYGWRMGATSPELLFVVIIAAAEGAPSFSGVSNPGYTDRYPVVRSVPESLGPLVHSYFSPLAPATLSFVTRPSAVFRVLPSVPWAQPPPSETSLLRTCRF